MSALILNDTIGFARYYKVFPSPIASKNTELGPAGWSVRGCLVGGRRNAVGGEITPSTAYSLLLTRMPIPNAYGPTSTFN
ncbi:MAG: hypothetical protein QNJ46_29620 [Leptolyngbyaceae cyanobacterium MO_188.B28]|nr:hypothetical protein [Leptolyngbyaceae cyanobacterium MO_188.B28]